MAAGTETPLKTIWDWRGRLVISIYFSGIEPEGWTLSQGTNTICKQKNDRCVAGTV